MLVWLFVTKVCKKPQHLCSFWIKSFVMYLWCLMEMLESWPIIKSLIIWQLICVIWLITWIAIRDLDEMCYWIYWNLKLILLSISIIPLPNFNFNFKFHMHILHATVCKPIDFGGQISKYVLFADFYAFTWIAWFMEFHNVVDRNQQFSLYTDQAKYWSGAVVFY